MTVYNKASLVLAESPAYKAGTIQPHYPLTPDVSFDFTRATSATRVNADGNIEKETQNLLLQSNQFDTTWVSNLGASGTIVNNQSGYDGSSDAWLLTKDATTFARVQQTLDTPISGVWTMSAYLKAGTATVSRFRFNSASYMVQFNFTTGVATDAGSVSAIDYGMTDVGNGWYRCYATFNASVSIAQIYVDYNTSTSTTMFVQDAQLEQGLVARDYQETTTSAFYGGITDNVPRLDYTDGSCPSVLLEPQRTNLIPHSEYFDEWGHYSNATAQLANVLSPEGKLNAYEFTFDGTTSGRIQDTIPVTDGNTYTFSVYLKNKNISTPTQVWIGFSNPSSQGEYVTVTNEWQRFETVQVANSGSAEYPRVLCNGVGSIYGYGAQMEEASYATSYIPAYGTSVTRNADDLDRLTNLSTNGIANNYSTTLFFEGTNFKTTANTRFVTLYNSSASSNPRVLLFSSNSNSSVFYMNLQYRATGQTDANVASGNMSYNTKFKAIMRLDGTSLSLFLDGTKYSTTIVQADDIEVLDLADVAADLSHTMSELAIFPTALTDDECIALTTL